MLNWIEIRDRIFELYGNPKQKELANALGIDDSVVSRWMTKNEKERRIPTMDLLSNIVKVKGVTWDWLLTGEEQAPPPAPASGAESLLPHLSRMAVELIKELSDIHLRALEGVVTEEQFEAILLGATGGMLEAARENEVETKKGTA